MKDCAGFSQNSSIEFLRRFSLPIFHYILQAYSTTDTWILGVIRVGVVWVMLNIRILDFHACVAHVKTSLLASPEN